MEPLAFGDLGHSVFSDDKLDEIVNKMKEEPVILPPVEAVTAKEYETPETLELAGKIAGMAEPGILAADPEKPKLNPDEFERIKPEIAKRLEIISNEVTDVAIRRTVRDELRENFGLDIGDEFLEEDERGRILREEMLRGASLYLSSGGEELGTWGANENGVKIFLQDMGYQFKPGEEPEVVPGGVVEPIPEAPVVEAAVEKWQTKLNQTLEIINDYPIEEQRQALINLKKDMVKGLAPAELLNSVVALLESPELVAQPVIDIPEAQRQLEMVYNNPDARARQQAARRWRDRFGSRIGTEDMDRQIEEILNIEPEKISEVEMGDEEQSKKIKTDVRMAMIVELSEKVSSNMNIPSSFDQFLRSEASRYGMGKNHFPKEYEAELKKEFYARAELASVLSFWDDLAGTQSSEVDTFKDMTSSKIDQCKKLSRSTYEWLSEIKNITYRKIEGLENVEGGIELREQMNIVSAELYIRMMRRDLDVWTTRGEDRGKIINDLALGLGVSIDSVRLSWQLAEAECWAARMNVGFVSHPAGRVMIPSEYRDFWTRNGSPLGGSRLWQEYLSTHGNVYPKSLEAPYSALGYGEKGVYDSEVRRLGRTGFEAWIVRVVDTEKENRYIDNRYNSGLRDGVIPLFSDRGGAPAELQDLMRINNEIFRVVTKDGVVLSMMPETSEVVDGVSKLKKQPDEALFVGGERALLAGKYFTCMEALVSQPGLLDVDLPQSVVMADLSKGAAVIMAMDALGKVDATKASSKELATLRNALVSSNFRFQSNDLVDRPEGQNSNRIIRIKNRRQEWIIGSGTKERMSKSKARVGEMMEQWTRSYVWLLSWQNPAHQSEGSVVGMANWVILARDVVLALDTNKQWGEYVGYGYGNTDANELAVEADGRPRKNPTVESKLAAQEYTGWFDTLFYKVIDQLKAKKIKFTTTVARIKKEADTDGERMQYSYNFWKNRWW
ncbi:MAG: hypothetical protein UW41_C0031G0003 [Candidatus Collierbacteria bacterium GW2011_GWC2_44_18]|uniref:Uncharacterized protein n=1 Tax=Candidatus Collierbacteria bacterium GW2011_GWC2_44_18 TaxID=1618392 RepID=A0A0G1HME6_9BACT|nr:MAG: hypothetical protein US48_C0013G0003 [Candidatus Levybacteria bacterium GW2011_GWA2_37_36]KKT29150.1 MAG: hypothetical protein UW16_C0034G0003 [Microgenomates group bacterium GW2011_GWC1_44_10]KKT48376.1 MAG: hypothetical protein UW41_C0031G0003 [Candidatus Collierbacteria bacterium GW2011_GWC2_44_18]